MLRLRQQAGLAKIGGESAMAHGEIGRCMKGALPPRDREIVPAAVMGGHGVFEQKDAVAGKSAEPALEHPVGPAELFEAVAAA